MGSDGSMEILEGEPACIAGLLDTAERLSKAGRLSDVLDAVVDGTAGVLGPIGGMLGLVDAPGRTVVIAALKDAPPSFTHGTRSLPLAACLPAAEAVRGGKPAWVDSPAERERRYPELAARTPEPYACGSLPLAVAGRVTGVLCLTRMLDVPGSRPFTVAERALAGVLAELAAAAVARLMSTEAKAETPRVPAPRSVPHDGGLGSALSAVMSMADLAEIVETALPSLGAEGLVIAEQDGRWVSIAARAGFAPAERTRMSADARARKQPGHPLAPRVTDIAASTGELLDRHPHFADLVAGAGPHAWSVAALPSDYDAPAACLLAFPPDQPPSGSMQARLVTLRGALAQALDRCRVYDREHRMITDLQGTMPAQLPGLRLAWKYQPGTPGLSMGGDFYDAFVSADGVPALVIGDVQGHGPAAAVMAARLRTAIRAYAVDSHEPAEIISRAGRFLAAMNGDSPDSLYATCCYLTIDPATGHGRVCRAGHPHPVVINGRGPAVLVAGDGGLPLGVDPAYDYRDTLFLLRPGNTVLLYTDGLIEHPDAVIGAGTEGLIRSLPRDSPADPAALLAGLRQFSSGTVRYDDIAVLAAAYTGLAAGSPWS